MNKKKEVRVKDFGRQELRELITRAEKWAEIVPSPTWKVIYQRLAEALNNLDAFTARSMGPNGGEK